MSVLSNLIYRLNKIPIKNPTSYFVDIDKLILKFYLESEQTHASRHSTEEQSQRPATASL